MKLSLKNGNKYYINKKKKFIPNTIETETLEKCFDFAVQMVFGEGHHREHRSGGQNSRKKGELFANTFQGKIAEFVSYNKFIKEGLLNIEQPDMNIHGKGIWDDTDLQYKNIKINIKSSAFFSNLLLLEQKDWNKKGQYIPNIDNLSSQNYDYFLMIRIKPDIKAILQRNKLFYSNTIDLSNLKELIFKEKYFSDFAGVCSQKTIEYIIENNYSIPQNALLNGKMKMDAANYYIQNGDLKDIEQLIASLKTI